MVTTGNKIQLNKDEHIVWEGTPRHGLIYRKSDAAFTLLVFIGILLFSIYLFTANFEQLFSMSFDSIVTNLWLIGLIFYYFIGRNIIDNYYRKNTFYLLTNQRVLIFYKGEEIFEKNRFSTIPTLIEGLDKYGSISFGKPISDFELVNNRFGWPSKDVLLNRFENIADARAVYTLMLLKIQSAPAAPQAK